MAPCALIASSSTAPPSSNSSVTSPVSPLPATVASSEPSSPSSSRSSTCRRLAGRAKARQVLASTRLCRLNDTVRPALAANPRALELGRQHPVSLTTSTSPGAAGRRGRSRGGRTAARRAAPPACARCRAARPDAARCAPRAGRNRRGRPASAGSQLRPRRRALDVSVPPSAASPRGLEQPQLAMRGASLSSASSGCCLRLERLTHATGSPGPLAASLAQTCRRVTVSARCSTPAVTAR